MPALTYSKIGIKIRLVKGFWKQSRATQGEEVCGVQHREVLQVLCCRRAWESVTVCMCAAQCTVSVCACVCVTKGLSQLLSGGRSYWLAKSWWNNHLLPPPFHSHLDKIYFRHTTPSKSKTLFDEVKWGLTYNPITVAFFFNVFETNKNGLICSRHRRCNTPLYIQHRLLQRDQYTHPNGYKSLFQCTKHQTSAPAEVPHTLQIHAHPLIPTQERH